jgi:hypothetical protein
MGGDAEDFRIRRSKVVIDLVIAYYVIFVRLYLHFLLLCVS